MLCVIPAAGRGVRFNELGKNYPKCVLPYKEKPIIAHNISLAFEAGATQVAIVVGHRGEKVREIVEMYFPEDDRVTFHDYIMHNNQDGPAVSIYCGVPEDIDSPVMVLLSDIVINEPIPKSNNSWISTQRVPDWERWCMAETQNGKIAAFHDKPKAQPNTDEAVSGIYYFQNGNKWRDCLEDCVYHGTEGELQISSAMIRYMESDSLETKQVGITDFGTLQEYLENRGINNSRDFNEVYPIENSLIVKKSERNPEKIHHEVNWYDNLPTRIKVITPRIFDKDLYSRVPSYTMERVDSPTVRELYLYLESDPVFWKDVYNQLFDIVEDFSTFRRPGDTRFFDTLNKKNHDRVSQIQFDHSEGLEFCRVYEKLNSEGVFNIFDDSLFHGDLCFSNIFYHPGSKHLKVIDPRGDAYGNILYDLAKITHSAYLPYDYIDAELYLKNGGTVFFDAGKEESRKVYKECFIKRFGKDTWNVNLFITASLFLTMIPLHGHNQTNQELFYDVFRKTATESGLLG